MVAKRGDRGVLLRPAETPVEARERNAGLFETIGEVRERLARMDEDKLLLRRVAPDEVDQRRLFAAGFDRRPSLASSAQIGSPAFRAATRATAAAAALGEEPAALRR